MEKSKGGTFPLRLEIPQRRRDSQFFHRPDYDDFIFLISPQKTGIADLQRIRLICSCEKEIHRPRRSAIQLKVKTILNRVQRFVGFVYQEVRMHGSPGTAALDRDHAEAS